MTTISVTWDRGSMTAAFGLGCDSMTLTAITLSFCWQLWSMPHSR